MGDFKLVKLIDPTAIVTGGLVPKGVYNGATAYAIGDSVSYNGTSYVAIVSTTGNLPTDTTKWQIIASKGSAGATGAAGPTGATGAAGQDGIMHSVVAGTGISVNNTDPANPIITNTQTSAAWGSITGTLASQTDLNTALAAKVATTRTVNGHALSADVTVTADDVLPTQTSNSGKYLTTNGTTSSWATAAGGGTFTMPTINKNLETTTSGTWTAGNLGSGAISNDNRRVIMSPGATANSLALMYWDWGVSNSWNVFQGTVQFAWAGWIGAIGSDFDSFIGVGDMAPDGSGMPGNLNRHFGFRRKRAASGSVTLICTNAEAGVETTTTVTDPGNTTNCFFGAVKTSANVKYYVNGALVATHTTNIPSGNSANFPMQIAINNANVATNTQLYTVEFSYQQQY